MYYCKSGDCIYEDQVCNGISDCEDQSDESSDICSSHYCPSYAFRCSYGACVQGNSRCNNIIDCLDGSDEAETLCGRPAPTTPTPLAPSSDKCAIPVLENGYVRSAANKRIYSAQDLAQNGEGLEFVCGQNSTLLGQSFTNCIEGSLLNPTPRCISTEWHYLPMFVTKRPNTTPSHPAPSTPSSTPDFRGLPDTTPGYDISPGDVRR